MADTAEETKEQTAQNPTGNWLGDDEARNFAVEGNDLSGYIGVDPEYMTYADDTHKPYSTDEEVLPPAEQLMFEEDGEEDGKADAETKKDETKKATTSSTTPSKSSTTGTASKTTSSK